MLYFSLSLNNSCPHLFVTLNKLLSFDKKNKNKLFILYCPHLFVTLHDKQSKKFHEKINHIPPIHRYAQQHRSARLHHVRGYMHTYTRS